MIDRRRRSKYSEPRVRIYTCTLYERLEKKWREIGPSTLGARGSFLGVCAARAQGDLKVSLSLLFGTPSLRVLLLFAGRVLHSERLARARLFSECVRVRLLHSCRRLLRNYYRIRGKSAARARHVRAHAPFIAPRRRRRRHTCIYRYIYIYRGGNTHSCLRVARALSSPRGTCLPSASSSAGVVVSYTRPLPYIRGSVITRRCV